MAATSSRSPSPKRQRATPQSPSRVWVAGQVHVGDDDASSSSTQASTRHRRLPVRRPSVLADGLLGGTSAATGPRWSPVVVVPDARGAACHLRFSEAVLCDARFNDGSPHAGGRAFVAAFALLYVEHLDGDAGVNRCVRAHGFGCC